MNATKMMLCAIGATIITSATAFGATAKTVDGIGSTEQYTSAMRPAAIDNRSSAAGAQIALNPQPLPPGIVEDDRYDW
ncbi:hypothetical protein [Methyloferula stellata]|uniref:hypothetical protein n=1 Tax=Methyloferula stellata TaxID=876270 RepID=UPI001AEBFA2F|nr:hypothetical protein [Methyloferula stellata]